PSLPPARAQLMTSWWEERWVAASIISCASVEGMDPAATPRKVRAICCLTVSDNQAHASMASAHFWRPSSGALTRMPDRRWLNASEIRQSAYTPSDGTAVRPETCSNSDAARDNSEGVTDILLPCMMHPPRVGVGARLGGM